MDWDHGNLYRDLCKIAHHMLHWDSLAPELGLDDVDVADIKYDHHTAEQQRLDCFNLKDYSVSYRIRSVCVVFNPQRACVRVIVVTFSVCLSQTDFEDGFVLSLQMGRQATV